MDYSSPIDNSQNSPKSNHNSGSLGEVGGEQPTKDNNDPSANYDILFDPKVFGTWMNETEKNENDHSNSSKSDRSKTVVDNSSVKTESSDFSIILKDVEELNDLVCFSSFIGFLFYLHTNI